MLPEKELEDFKTASEKCLIFWEEVGQLIPEWVHVRNGKMTAGEVRQDFIHSHAIVLQALGRVGKFIYQTQPENLKKILSALSGIDWSRKNTSVWEGRAMIGGRMSKNSQNITLTCNQIKAVLQLRLSPEEQDIENAFLAGRQG